MADVTVAALPGLLGFLSDDQRAVLTAAAGLDSGGARPLAEVAELVGQSPDVVWYYLADVGRTLLRGLVAPDPTALRLLCSLVCEGGLAEQVATRGLYSLLRVLPALRAGAFPAEHTFSVINLWTGGTPGQQYPAGLRVLDAAGAVLHTEALPLKAVGVGGVFAQEFRVTLAFPTPGLYSLETWLLGAPLYAHYLPVFEYVAVGDEQE